MGGNTISLIKRKILRGEISRFVGLIGQFSALFLLSNSEKIFVKA